MAEFDYVAIDPGGRETRGQVSAPSVEQAKSLLDRRRLFVVRMAPGERAAPVARPPALFARRARLSAKELGMFTRQLATLTQVSPIEESLRTIGRQSEKAHVRAVIDGVHGAILQGRRLAEAMGTEPKSFPALYRAMIAAGENSGSLPVILERLSELLERQAVIRSKVVTAITYPLVLAGFAIIVVAALMILVVPKVVEQFDTNGLQLPLLTRVVMGISHFLVGWWWALLLASALIAVGVWRALRNERLRFAADRLLLRLPLFGRLQRDLHAARMARTLATMVASRLPLMEGVALTVQTVHNRALRRASEEIVDAIRGGGSLSSALRRARVFPPLLVYMAASGESAGRLDTMLARAADYLEREFDTFTTAALSLLEPAIIVAMGGVVAVIVLSLLLPILQLQSLVAS